MEDRALAAQLLPSAFVSSFVGRARKGLSLTSPDHAERASAWAEWAIRSLSTMSGMTDRTYVALVLDGRFYDPKGTGPAVRPHLEIPARRMTKADPEFPDRLALAGNGLAFPWWVVSEVIAVRRSIFNTPDTAIESVVDLLGAHQVVLREALEALMVRVAPQWSIIEAMLASSAAELSADASGDFSAAEVAEYFPAGRAFHLAVSYDAKLRESNRLWSARRVGVWQLAGITPLGERFSLGVVTPRLTANSLFRDALFSPAAESPAALLVRGLLLRRLAAHWLANSGTWQVGDPEPQPEPGPKSRLRTVVAQPGQKLPEASLAAAVNFLQTHPDADEAFAVLETFALRTGTLLTVTHDGFCAGHRNALRFLRRAEDPEREDINVVLPLGWDEKSRVVRITFSLPQDDAEPAALPAPATARRPSR